MNKNNKNIEFEKLRLLFLEKKYKEAKILSENFIKKYPKDIILLKLIAEQEYSLENYQEAKKSYNKVIALSNESVDPFIKLTAIYSHLKEYDNVIKIASKGICVYKNNLILYRNLVIAQIHEKKFLEAFENIKIIEEIDIYDEVPASFGWYLKEQLDLNYKFKYLNNPINYLRKYSTSKLYKNNFLKKLNSFIEEIPKTWEPKNQTTKFGYQSENNLFYEYKESNILKAVVNLISKSIEEYRENFKKSEDLFIKDFPDEFYLVGWGVDLRKSGYQGSHNHRDSWLSGVLYLKIPKNLNNNEGNIEFSSHGYNLPISNKKKISSSSFKPFEGALVMFPSSLFHRTIPFISEDNRICIAFDVRKIK